MKIYIKFFVLALAMICSFSQITDAQVKGNNKTTISRSKHEQAVKNLKNMLSKTEGMKFGSKEFYSFSARYIESENVFEHKYIQSVFPKEAADKKLLSAVKQEGLRIEKNFIKKTTELLRLMNPLRPTIRCIVYYPDNTVCLRFSFPYDELYFNN